MKGRFPTPAVIILVVAIIWFISELGYLNVNILRIPLILMILTIGWDSEKILNELISSAQWLKELSGGLNKMI